MHALDGMEKRILALLQKDASLSSSEIAEPVNFSQSTVRRRTNSLEKSANIDEKEAPLRCRENDIEHRLT